ncbi:MAG: alpha/beta hydrolase [Gemmataceae bacterium]
MAALSRRQWFLASGGSAAAALLPSSLTAAEPPFSTNVYAPGAAVLDDRMKPFKTLDDSFPFRLPKSSGYWGARRINLRERLLVANGLWPMPERTPLNAVIHSPIARAGYTVEKVFFQSRPGHTVCGNLYRPTAKSTTPRPGILFAHGHWENGRLHDAGPDTVAKAISSKAEDTAESARYFMQALPASLAKLGFVVFHYDMVGYGDSTAIPHVQKSATPHPEGFADMQGELHLQSLMGLQTWNSLRSLDFLAELPGVDPKRIGMTGASGGGTQTFILAGIDHRIAVAAPAVMVSTGMQGGCICENCSLLRLGTGNIEIAALCAPRPLALTGANDWTKAILTSGFPELKKLYAMLGNPENVVAKCWPEFPHNYNQRAREFVYAWFRKHLMGQDGEVKEPPFEPIPPEQLRVFDSEHPRPKSEKNAKELRAAMIAEDKIRFAALNPGLQNTVLSKAIWSMTDSNGIEFEPASLHKPMQESVHDGFVLQKLILGLPERPEAIPTLCILNPKKSQSLVVIWAHPEGKAALFQEGKLIAPIAQLLAGGAAVLAPDLLGIGEQARPYTINKVYAGYTFGYNRTLAAERITDLLRVIYFAHTMKPKQVHLVGVGGMGPLAVLTHFHIREKLSKVAAEDASFDSAKITSFSDPMLIPGLEKYGGWKAFRDQLDPKLLKTADRLDWSMTVPWLIK